MLLKIQTLEGANRYLKIYKENPPIRVYVFVRRLNCAKNGDFTTYATNSAICYAWFVWQKGYKGKPFIDWLYEEERQNA